MALCIRDRRRKQLGELPQSLLRLRWQKTVGLRADAHNTPQAAFDDDRRPHRRAPARGASEVGAATDGSLKAVDPCRPTGLEDQPGRSTSLERESLSNNEDTKFGVAGAGPFAEGRHRAVGPVAADGHGIRGKQPTNLGAHCLEHLGRPGPLRYEGCHATQRRLLLREFCELLTTLGVRDCRRHQPGEPRQTPLRVDRQGPVGCRDDGQDAPEAALNGDRRPHRRLPAHLAGSSSSE